MMKDIDEIPDGHWMILDKDRNVIFHSPNLTNVLNKGKKYPIDEITIESKFAGLII